MSKGKIDYSSFYSQISTLGHIPRYSNIPRITTESVAAHSFFVSALVVKLHEEYEFDLGKALTMSVVHDWGETVLGDITVATKRMSFALAEAAKKLEANAVYDMVSDEIYRIWYEYESQGSVEAKVVKLADVMQCIQYASMEVALGNKGYMEDVYNESIQREEVIRNELIAKLRSKR